jgi:DNA-binding MarR family transcriptional regulator
MEANESAEHRSSRPTPAVMAWLRLARVFQRIEHLSGEHLKRWSLSGAHFDVLVHVGETEGITQQDLASALLVTKGNICQLLDRMERDGLVRRVPDGRSNKLFLTDEGRALFSVAVPDQEAAIDGLVSSLTRSEQLQLFRLLSKLDRSLSSDKQVQGGKLE